MPAHRLILPQTTETPVSAHLGARFGYRVAYARSADSQAHNDKGQDYLTLRADDERLAFALCDGVSQSFMGDLAAQLVGEALVDWLWQALPDNAEASAIQAPLAEFLNQQAPIAAETVRTFALAPDLLPMIRDVLERKRELGTETTFIGGCVDVTAGRLTLAWMGDSRVRLWGAEGELTGKLLGEDKFLTAERWSSRRGLVGELHVAILPLRRLKRVLAYTDGLGAYDGQLNQHLSDADLNRLISASKALPTSDDVSVMEVWLGQRPAPFKPAPDPAPHATMVALPAVKLPPTIDSASALATTFVPTSPTPLRPVKRPPPARNLSWALLAIGLPVVLCALAVIAILAVGGADWLWMKLKSSTATPELTRTHTPAPTPPGPPTRTPTRPPTATATATVTNTQTPIDTATLTDTLTPTETITPTDTIAPTDTLTPTATLTLTLTLTVSPAPTQ